MVSWKIFRESGAESIWAVAYGDLAGIKRVPSGTFHLMSDNPAVTPITAYDGEMHVLGRVVAFFRKM